MTETRSRLTRQSGSNDLGLGGQGVSEVVETEPTDEPGDGPEEPTSEDSDISHELAQRLRSVRGVGPATIDKIAAQYSTVGELDALDDLTGALERLGVRTNVAEQVAVELDDSEERESAAEGRLSGDDPLLVQLTSDPDPTEQPAETGRTQQVRVDYHTYKRLRATVARLEAEGRDAPTMTEIATHALDRWLDLLEGAQESG